MVTNYAEIAPNYDKNPLRVKGVDEEIEKILQKHKNKIRILDLACGTIENLKTVETNIDYIRNEFAFHHFTDKEAAVKNINRMLKPNG